MLSCRVSVVRLLLLAAVVPAAMFLYGCADMPIVAPPPGEDKPIGEASIVMGPYLTSADGKQPLFRIVTNRRCVPGIQALESKRKYVNRQASFSLFHSLAIPELDAGSLKLYRLWLDDKDGGAYAVRGLPRNGQAVSIGFAGGRADGDRLRAVGDRLRDLDPNAVVFLTPPFAGGVPDAPAEWESAFFGPLGDKIALGPMWFAPGGDIPADLFPENAEEGGYWKRDVGAVRLIGIDARAFNFEASMKSVLANLDRDLDPGHTRRAWTVVVLSRGAFDARVGDARILAALGDRLEMGRVDLVIGPGQYYVRTRPFSVGGNGQTRYITVADVPNGPPQNLEPREYVAAATGAPHVGRLWADEGTLEWQIIDMDGRTLDILTLEATRKPIETAMSKWEVISDAQSALTLQKEMLRITRQAARAVPDPNQRVLLSLFFANPTTKRFAGQLAWEIAPGSGWRLEPEVMPFDLQPGQGAVARFAVSPGAASSPPTLVASSPDVGSTSAQLILTREQRFEVMPIPDAFRLDARPREKQYWKDLAALPGLRTVDGGTPANPTEARVTADKDGLILGLSMVAKGVSSFNPKASRPEEDRDGPVLEDESIEIFIDPTRRGRDYYRFAINPRNVVLDESSRGGTAYNPTWRRSTRFGRTDSLETWDVEIRIPWEAVGLAEAPANGDEWGLQIVRHDYAAVRAAADKRGRGPKPGPELSEWVPSGGDNTRPGLYGVIRFGDLTAAPSGDGQRAAPAPGGFLIRGGQIPLRPGRILTPIPEPPTPDF